MFDRQVLGRNLSGGEQRSGNHPLVDVDVKEAQALQEQGAQLIDVREPYEFANGHARGARNIPLGDLLHRKDELDSGATLLLICQSGVRSVTGQQRLLQQAFPDVRNVTGGTAAWKQAGLPMDR
jgi:rhodanese-related sulfurtransferase